MSGRWDGRRQSTASSSSRRPHGWRMDRAARRVCGLPPSWPKTDLLDEDTTTPSVCVHTCAVSGTQGATSMGPALATRPKHPGDAQMSRRYVRLAAVSAATGVLTGVTGAQPSAFAASHHRAPARHVLLISVDGLHQSDLAWYVGPIRGRRWPRWSRRRGVHARADDRSRPTPSPAWSPSSPAAARAPPASSTTTPTTTRLLPRRDSTAARRPATEAWHRGRPTRGPGSGHGELHRRRRRARTSPRPARAASSAMTGDDPDRQPDRPRGAARRPGDLQAGLPALVPQGEHGLRGRQSAGLRTAWSDKHPAYEILNGPSGTGVQDLFTPEINSVAPLRRPATTGPRTTR